MSLFASATQWLEQDPRVFQIIRDRIDSNQIITFFKSLQPGNTLRLIAKEVVLDSGLDMQQRNLEIYAASLTALNNSEILSRGVNGSHGRNGGFAETINGPGGAGHNGSKGGIVKIVAQVIKGLKINVSGGKGGNGGVGLGGKQGKILNWPSNRPPPAFLQAGGSGHVGGDAGYGGDGGSITVTSVVFLDSPSYEVLGGSPGVPGTGGVGGRGDILQWYIQGPAPDPLPEPMEGETGPQGPFGKANPPGGNGTVITSALTYDQFWSALAFEPFAIPWAKYRYAVGEFHFRSYIPGVVRGREHHLGSAIDEFSAALLLHANQPESTLSLRQIENNINPLGWPRDYDVIPNFKEYIDQFTNLGSLQAAILNIGATSGLRSSDELKFKALMSVEQASVRSRLETISNEIAISKQQEADIETAKTEVRTMMEDVQERIEQAKEEMKSKPMTIGNVLGNIGELAVAVGAIMAAAPTGGASLIALAPEIISLSETIYDNAAPLAKALIDKEETETLALVKDKFAEVKKDVENVRELSGKVTSLVKMINHMQEEKKKVPDNAKLLDLLQTGAELAYESLLKQLELERTRMKTEALLQESKSANELMSLHQKYIDAATVNEQMIREGGMAVVHAVMSTVDITLHFAFCAQRSLEIYLLENQAHNVFYDAGRVHPDYEAAYVWDPENLVTLQTEYTKSFTHFLNPTVLWETYQRYFGSASSPIQPATRRLEFGDRETIERFRSSLKLTFNLDVNQLSENRFRTKIQSIGISFVGATGTGRQISCFVEHGSVYSERVRVDGPEKSKIVPTILKVRKQYFDASVKPLETDGFSTSNPPLENVQRSALWAMGIGGLYTVTVPESEIREHAANFDGLTKIEVWVAYQFVE